MDPCIENLKSTTFSSKRFSRKQLATIQQTVNAFPTLSRRELAHTICELLQWYTPKGDNKIQSCLSVLESLEKLGLFSLPQKEASKQRGAQKTIEKSSLTETQPDIVDTLDQLTPIRLQIATEKLDVQLWNEFIDRHHYLGYKRPIGPHIRYFILDKNGRKLGCLMFSYAVKSLPCRDEWIGWQDKAHKKHLDLVINNNRFLIFPWVNVKCLASKALSIAARQLRDDWALHHGYRPVLIETFVDPTKFNATCYRAANWQHIGESKGRKSTKKVEGKASKNIYIYPLIKNAKFVLLSGPEALAKTENKKRQSKRIPNALKPTDPFIELWQNIIGTVMLVANDFDRQWQKRQRVLNTLLIMLFIFRLVFSKNKQGYAITIAELWDQCNTMGIALPQAKPVAASAFCTARSKLDENIFKLLQVKILEQAEPSNDSKWKGHCIYAVDGSKINLPRQLLKSGYKIPSDNAHYPQGLLSCLYQLKTQIPVDYSLVNDGDERRVALTHLDALSANDVVVYDRGYYSYAMLYEHKKRNIQAIFRMRSTTCLAVQEFIAGNETDQTVEITLTKTSQAKLPEKYPELDGTTLPLRLVKYTVGGTSYTLGTTLLGKQQYTIKDLSDAYHSRWGIEELYKISKQLMSIEEFHGQSERGVKQELYAHFVLITLTRLFSNHSEIKFNSGNRTDEGRQIKANFKNCLTTVARNIEGLLLSQATLLNKTINSIIGSISTCRQKLRPNRSYDRTSRKPIGKWKPAKRAKPTKPDVIIAV